jgi:hypothetical protein
MIKNIRRALFVIYVLFLRLPMWTIIWLVGRTGVIKTIFLIYPTDRKEYADLSPDFKFLRKFMSGRPTPAGVILDKWKPVGIYLFISNTPQELIKKKNRHIAEAIARRMLWIQRLSGAKACGFAGQLGPILEKRHGIAMEPPFYSSTMGNIFSIDDSISFLAKSLDKHPWQLSIAVLGGGELGGMLQEHFTSQGYKADILDVTFKPRGGVKVTDMEAAGRQLDHADFVINLLPTGEDFLSCGTADFLKSSTSVIDFSRPSIPREKLQAKVFMGNRVQRSGMRFAFALPGGWQQKELPACSIPSILASNFGIVEKNLTRFCMAARRVAFQTALAAAVQPAPRPLLTRLQLLGNEFMMNCRFYMFVARKNFMYAPVR